MIATLRAQITARAEVDNWFASANDSLDWMRDNQAIAAGTYDWRVTLRRFGVKVSGPEEDQSCGPKGSGGMARKIAAHRQLLLDVSDFTYLNGDLFEVLGLSFHRTRAYSACVRFSLADRRVRCC